MTDKHHGVFVAFDALGNHYAYARHWKDVPACCVREQRNTIASYRASAKRKGGRVKLLKKDEFERVVLSLVS